MGLLSFPRLNKFLTRFPWALYFFCSVLIFIQMEISNGNSAKNLSPIYVLFNIITISMCLLLLWVVLENYRIAGLLGSALFGIWRIANYFTVEFLGIPISPNDLLSAETALNVLGKYEIVLRAGVLAIILLVILEVWLCFQLPLKIDSAKRKPRWLGRAGAAIGSCAFEERQKSISRALPIQMKRSNGCWIIFRKSRNRQLYVWWETIALCLVGP